VPQPTPPPEPEPEPDIQVAFERIVSEGADRLARPWLPLVQTGLLGGIDVGTGVFAYLVVMAKTHDTLLAGLPFSVGFVALLLARSELFTENFLVPVTAVVARKGTPGALARLWGTTLALNLVGGWVITWLIIEARPDLKATAVEAATHYTQLGVNRQSFALAVLAGLAITLMTRMQRGVDSGRRLDQRGGHHGPARGPAQAPAINAAIRSRSAVAAEYGRTMTVKSSTNPSAPTRRMSTPSSARSPTRHENMRTWPLAEENSAV